MWLRWREDQPGAEGPKRWLLAPDVPPLTAGPDAAAAAAAWSALLTGSGFGQGLAPTLHRRRYGNPPYGYGLVSEKAASTPWTLWFQRWKRVYFYLASESRGTLSLDKVIRFDEGRGPAVMSHASSSSEEPGCCRTLAQPC